MELTVSKGSEGRLRRIQVLKGYTETQALDFAISVAWAIAEKKAFKKAQKERGKTNV